MQFLGVLIHPTRRSHPGKVNQEEEDDFDDIEIETGAARESIRRQGGRRKPEKCQDQTDCRLKIADCRLTSGFQSAICTLQSAIGDNCSRPRLGHMADSSAHRMPGVATLMPLRAIFNCSGLGATSSAVARSMSPRSTSCLRFSVKSIMPSWKHMRIASISLLSSPSLISFFTMGLTIMISLVGQRPTPGLMLLRSF